MKNLLRKKLAALFAMADTQPYSREVDSIQSEYDSDASKVTYIDTDILPSWDEDFEMVSTFTRTSNNRIIFLGNYSGNLTNFIEITDGGRLRIYITASTSTDPSYIARSFYTDSTIPIPLNVPTKIWVKYSPQNDTDHTVNYEIGFEALDGSANTKDTGSFCRYGSPTSARTLRVFTDYRSPASSFNGGFKIHQLEIKHGSIHKKYIACLDKSNVPCFYEAISKKLAYNDGSGNFTAGKEIHPVEYIVFDGTQRFNSGFYPNTLSTTLKATFALTGSDSLGKFPFGVRKISGYGDSCSMYIAPTTTVAPYGYLRLDWAMQNGTDRYKFISDTEKITLEATGNYANVNGEEFTSTVVTSFDHPAPFYIGNCYTESSSAFQSGFVGQLWDLSLLNTTSRILYRDFIPAVDELGNVFLHDKENHAVFVKATGSEFVISVKGVEYKPAAYLESTGTQYIDTGVYMNSDYGVEIEAKQTSETSGVGRYLFGDAPAQNTRYLICVTAGTGNYRLGMENANKDSNVSAYDGNWHTHKVENKTYYIDGVSQGSLSISDFTAGRSSRLFSVNTTSTLSNNYWQIKKCRITDGNGKLLLSYIPVVRVSDSVAGMLDLVDGSFHPNDGTGTFTVGARS